MVLSVSFGFLIRVHRQVSHFWGLIFPFFPADFSQSVLSRAVPLTT